VRIFVISLTCWGREEPVEIIWSSPLLRAESARLSCVQYVWVSPALEILQPLCTLPDKSVLCWNTVSCISLCACCLLFWLWTLPKKSVSWFGYLLRYSTAFRPGTPSTGKTRSSWSGSRGGPLRWSEGWSTSPMKKGWGNWACLAWKEKGPGRSHCGITILEWSM